MPPRPKNNKRRGVAGLDEWESVFASGFDFFDELPPCGIDTDAYGRPDIEAARQAWERLGAEFMQLPRHPDLGPSWAELEFGGPHAC